MRNHRKGDYRTHLTGSTVPSQGTTDFDHLELVARKSLRTIMHALLPLNLFTAPNRVSFRHNGMNKQDYRL